MEHQVNVVGGRPGDAERPQESGVAALGRGGRMSRQRNRAAVLRLLRGEDLETVSRELGVTAATLTNWHDAFLAAGEAALTTRAVTGEELESYRLKARLGARLVERHLLNEMIALLESVLPFVRRQAQAMSRTLSPITGKPYGLVLACRVWRLARSGVYRHQSGPPARQRRGPLGAMSDDALTTAIQDVLAATPFHGEGHRKVWARLRYAGTRTSMRRVLRLMRQNNLLAPTRVGSPRGPRNHDGTIIPDTVDAMWGTDLTTTITGEGQATVFIAVDHCSAECVGIHAHPQATRFQALEPIRQGVRQRFGGFGKASARGLAVWHDHGSQYMSHHFQKEIAFLGIESSPAFCQRRREHASARRSKNTSRAKAVSARQ